MNDVRSLPDDLKRIFQDDERPAGRAGASVVFDANFGHQATSAGSFWPVPGLSETAAGFLASRWQSAQPDPVEEAFLNLYCHLHGHEAPYSASERRRMDELGGYWCHAGGLSPILKAGQFIGPDTVSADFGAGNGLQGLLLQKLYPHARTIQIEISSRMVAWGIDLQEWLGIEPGRVEWVVGDVLEYCPRGIDFIYLYRPVRPEGKGRPFYENFAAELAATTEPVIIFSVADCLASFVADTCEVFYSDGHLTCFRRR